MIQFNQQSTPQVVLGCACLLSVRWHGFLDANGWVSFISALISSRPSGAKPNHLHLSPFCFLRLVALLALHTRNLLASLCSMLRGHVNPKVRRTLEETMAFLDLVLRTAYHLYSSTCTAYSRKLSFSCGAKLCNSKMWSLLVAQ